MISLAFGVFFRCQLFWLLMFLSDSCQRVCLVTVCHVFIDQLSLKSLMLRHWSIFESHGLESRLDQVDARVQIGLDTDNI